MRLHEFIRTHAQQILDEWVRTVVARFDANDLSKPLLVDDLPDFLQEIAACLQLPSREARYEGAENHGRQRLHLGLDIGQLIQEFGLVGATILRMAVENGVLLDPYEAWKLLTLTADGAAQAARAYAELRDRQVEQQTAEHFSFMAHEIRTPLQTARLATSLLKKSQGECAASLARLERAHARLADLVDNAILSARLHGRPRLRLERVQVRSLAEEVTDEIRPQADNRQLTLELSFEQGEFELDYKLIYSALINLMGNAVKFSHPKGRICFTLSVSDREACFEVADACGGMPRGLPEQLFQPFVQGAEDRTGFGLGLMIVQQAAAAHGGSISVQNYPGKGCRFLLKLPRTTGEP